MSLKTNAFGCYSSGIQTCDQQAKSNLACQYIVSAFSNIMWLNSTSEAWHPVLFSIKHGLLSIWTWKPSLIFPVSSATTKKAELVKELSGLVTLPPLVAVVQIHLIELFQPTILPLPQAPAPVFLRLAVPHSRAFTVLELKCHACPDRVLVSCPSSCPSSWWGSHRIGRVWTDWRREHYSASSNESLSACAHWSTSPDHAPSSLISSSLPSHCGQPDENFLLRLQSDILAITAIIHRNGCSVVCEADVTNSNLKKICFKKICFVKSWVWFSSHF